MGLSDDNVIKQLVAESQCEVCGRFFEAEDIRILGHYEEMWVLQVCCGACHSESMLAALENEDPESLEIISDLTETEFEKFESVVITGDDVLDTYNFLIGFQGDCSRLFE
jgi:hypothetical protein